MKFKRRTICSVVVVLLVMGLPLVALSAKSRRVTVGTWGGTGIRVTVEGKAATIEYDCAHGTISGPLKIDSRGRFKFSGTHIPERGGPVRSDHDPDSIAVEFTGWTDGRKMTLTVYLKGSGEKLGHYSLTRGNTGRLFKCL